MKRAPFTLFAALLLLPTLLPGSALAEPLSGPVIGDIRLPGVLSPVRTRRDGWDIPHIFGRHDRDVLFGLGRAHARDRFFQMDTLRRTFSGTLAELVGKDALESDVQLRTLGLRRAAQASLGVVSVETRVWLEAYARGVNSYILDPANPLPPEYGALELTRSSIVPWTPLDSLTIAKGLAFGLSFDLGDIDLTVALAAFGQAGTAGGFDANALFFEDVYRAAPFDPAVSVPDFFQQPPSQGILKSLPSPTNPRTVAMARRYREKAMRVPALRAALERRESGRGSNWWVASGSVTDSGRPILANDPHLQLGAPSTFYEAQLRITGSGRPAMNAFGVTFPGVPGIVLGCNLRICWGATTNPMDVTDVYQERLVIDPELGLPTHTIFEGREEPLVVIAQTFRTNQLGDSLPDNLVDAGIGLLDGGVTLVVPRRNNGPIVAVDLSDPENPTALSVQYTGWGPTRELDAFRIWSRAENLDQFKNGLRFFDVGSQNWSYADVDGNIAYFTSGEMPLREDLQLLERADGGIPPFLIRDGAHTLRHEWLPAVLPREPDHALPYTLLPFSEMPQEVNPERGWIANANNDPVGTSIDNDPLNRRRRKGGLYYLGIGYDRGYRIGRIERLLKAELERDGSFSVEDFKRMQADNRLLDAEVLTPYILQAFTNAQASGALAALAADPRIAEAVGRLRDWDFSTPTGIPEGWDAGDDPASLPTPSAQEVANSVAATIYSVWRGQVLQRVIDGTLAGLGLEDFVPPGDVALEDLRHLLATFPTRQGHGASGIDFFAVAGAATPAEARDRVLLESLDAALDLLASDAFAPAFDGSTDQDDYRWGKLHRIVFDHLLGGPFDIPPAGGLSDLEPDLRGVARSGGFGTVDAAAHNPRADGVNEFMFGSGPARRFVGTLQSSGPAAEEVIPGGTSGIPGSPFQVDQLRLWLTNRYHPWLYRPGEVAAGARTLEGVEPVR